MKYLLTLSFGPVQEFIAAARRTADLYAGSQILQEVVGAAARRLAGQGADLIFPWHPEAKGSNKILLQLEGDPKAAARKAREAAEKRLEELWEEALAHLGPELRGRIDLERAELQRKSFLEVYAAWVPLKGRYPEARQRVERLLAGRKALRDFPALEQGDEGVPKSPLDPARAAVIRPEEWQEAAIPTKDGKAKPLRVRPTEHLDAVSLLKRIYGVLHLEKVVDTRTMARRALEGEAPPRSYDEEDDLTPEAQPYFAILVADGDRMGKLIAEKESPEEHKALSQRLDRFSEEVERIVQAHHGFPVYTGGDDVLAFLPVNRAVACAKALNRAFRQWVLEGTLSAGLAIVHYREPLSLSLEAARRAERAAKDGGRNALAVALHTRGGAPVTVVRGWEELEGALDWDCLVRAYRDRRVSRGLAYELSRLAREWLEGMEARYLQAEARRILARKEMQDLALPELPSAQALKAFADQLIIARFLSGIPLEE